MTEISAWFTNYVRFLDVQDHAGAKKIGDYFLCPCCQLPTLEERATYEICQVCWWEDDGQDEATADQVTGGPNGRHSLTRARENFGLHMHMYDPEAAIDVVHKPSKRRLEMLQYLEDIRSERAQFSLERFRELVEAL
ncbi:Cysteine-rich CPCC [Aliiroseovarius crassostreae]|uniref:Cysteine-rich CPCC domain-containing protein n=1 Tax=Aliiroseovarius crassostreae TaxID=154981 RepID=A0A0P7IWP9_9RHOB|nr:CPCC family cysteine-rich protein [Aliiroseovarius crassostreae]KPN63965.1 hypothetical protein AKJ29_14940 [Aliiroseovarius crassostreae]SFU50537.1 Cysteine-rich CPCC [Aliiroseovarius crassostreae]